MATEQPSIRIEGRGPYGFRLFGGESDPLTVAKLRKRSKAWDAGLEEGDELLTINGQSCRNISHTTAMILMDSSSPYLNLKVLRNGGSCNQQKGRIGNRQRSVTPDTGTTSAPWMEGLSGPLPSRPQPTTNTMKSYIRLESPVCQTPFNNKHHESNIQPAITSYANYQYSRPVQTLAWRPGSTTILAAGEGNGKKQIESFTGHITAKEQSPVTSAKSQFHVTSTTSSRLPAIWKSSWQAATTSDITGANSEMERKRSSNLPTVISGNPALFFQTGPLPSLSTEPRKFEIWKPNTAQTFNKLRRPTSPETEMDLNSGDCTSTGSPQDFPANINKILRASSVTEADPCLFTHQEKKKVFCNSSFYDDSKHVYPTVDEQIKMARQVALSLTAPVNASTRGHRMFMKRKERSDKFVVDSAAVYRATRDSDTDGDLYYNATPWKTGSWKAPCAMAEQAKATDIPPPISTSKLFAPKINPEYEKSKALGADEFERLRIYSQKTTHDGLSPQVAFGIAEDLKQSKGKGGRMFAKRRAMSEKWVNSSVPDEKILQKISGGFVLNRATGSQPEPVVYEVVNDIRSNSLPPVNKLKAMIELPKPKMTPWDAVVEYGNVDEAFQHLADYSFFRQPSSNPFADTVANSLQQVARQRKMQANNHPSQTPQLQKKLNQLPQDMKLNGWPMNDSKNVCNSSSTSATRSFPGYQRVNFRSSENTSTNGGGFSDL